MEKNKNYCIELNEEELQMIYKIFSRLEKECFAKWRELWPEDREKPSEKCTEQWILLGKIDEIKNRIAEPLGLSVRKEL